MNIAVISDIHGNLVALDAVLEFLRQQQVDRIVCAGDVVNFGPEPNACVARLIEAGIPSVRGNTDREVLQPPAVATGLTQRLIELEQIAQWGRQRLTGVARDWLGSLPLTYRPHPEVMVVHATPAGDAELCIPEDAAAYPFPDGVRVIAAGHLHSPFVLPRPDGRLWVNAGSVGRPTDGDPRASLAILTRAAAAPFSWSAQVVRVLFDLHAAADAIRTAGMPFAEKLVQTQGRAQWWLA